ncbi:MAG: response regulator [Myxococcota bacterium]|nr:response regulator [Myxococcota bacterium]
MKLRSQLQLGFTFLVFLVLGAGGFSLYAFQQTRNIHKNEAPEDWNQALQILKCERALMDWDHSLRRLVMATGSTRFASRLEAMQTQRSGLLDCLNKLTERETHKLYLQSAKNHFGALEKASYRIVEQAREGPIAEAQESLIKRWEPTQVLLYQDLLGLVLSYRSDTQNRYQETADKIEMYRDRVGLVIAISLLLTLFVAWRTGRKVGGRLLWLSDGLSTLLGQDVEVSDSPQQADQTLAAGAHRLPIVQSLLDSLEGGCILLERHSIVAINPEAERLLSPIETGQTLHDILEPLGFSAEEVNTFLQEDVPLKSDQAGQHIDFSRQAIDDEISLINCLDSSGVTVLKERQKAVVETLPSAIVDDDLKILVTGTPLAELVASDSAESLIGMPLEQVVQAKEEQLPDLGETTGVSNWTGLLHCADDRTLQGTLISLGQGQGAIFIAHDVTQTVQANENLNHDLRTLREQLRETEKRLQTSQTNNEILQQRGVARKDLMTGLNQEVRGPLHSVIGLSQLVADQAGQPMQLRASAQQLQSQAQRIMETIYDVQDLVQLETGSLDFNARSVRPAELVDAVVKLFRNEAKSQGLDLILDSMIAADLQVVVDDLRLRQMINCLLRRSLYYTESGTVSVRGEAERSGGKWTLRIEVSDSGPSIPADQKDKVFGVLGSRSHPGAERWCGIDLLALKLLAQGMGGHAFFGDEGTGITRFGFSVVVEESGIETEAPPILNILETEASMKLSARVLVVEDDPVNQLVAQAMLEKLGLIVEVVSTGAEVEARLSTLKKGTPVDIDLVLMDVMLASESGLDLTRQVRQWEKEGGYAEEIPILAVTARTEAEDRDACLNAGMNGFISKPYRAEELSSAIESILTSNQEAE